MSEREFFRVTEDCHAVVEPAAWINDVVISWSKTHIIYQKTKDGKKAIEIIRFRSPDKQAWKFAANPYAGIDLTEDEWRQVFG